MDAKNDVVAEAEQIANKLIDCFKQGGRIFLAGNGGSASMSSHFAAELVNKLKDWRKPLPAISLTSDTSVITSIANDSSFKYIFSRQLEALGKRGDILITMSTSGSSENIYEVQKTAKSMGIATIAFPTNMELGTNTQETQVIHLKLIHSVSKIVEDHYLAFI